MKKSGPQKTLGLCVRENIIYLVEANSSDKLIKINKLNYKKLPKGVICSDHIKNSHYFLKTLAELLEETEPENTLTSINVPTQFCLFRTITCSEAYTQESDFYRWEMQNYVADSIENYTLSALKFNAQEEGMVHCFICAVPSKEIDERLAILESSGLTPLTTEPDTIAIYNSLSFVNEKLPDKTLFIDVAVPFISVFSSTDNQFRFGGAIKAPKALYDFTNDPEEEPTTTMTESLYSLIATTVDQFSYKLGLNMLDEQLNSIFLSGISSESPTFEKLNTLFPVDLVRIEKERLKKLKFKTTIDLPYNQLSLPIGLTIRRPYEPDNTL